MSRAFLVLIMGNALQMVQRTRRWIPDRQAVFFEKILELGVVGAAVPAANITKKVAATASTRWANSSETRTELKRFVTNGT
jgi:hypothetical protein